MIAALAGLYLPSLWIRAKADRRQRDIINGFPDALDLMLVCVEAGLGLEAAFARVGMEITTSHPRLAEQLGAVVLELRAGRSHEDALRRMADRAGADEIRAFSTLLIQSTKLGSSIAQTLRTYASEMRERRRMRAEEKAHRLPVLLSIPLVTCMLPVMIGVLMLPAAIRVARAVLPALQGQMTGG
jgi:tight adherence protein C